MPYDHAKFVQDARELRGLLGGVADGLSDRAVVERALEMDDTTIQPATKQYLKDQYGESAWSSAGKSFVRSTMLDSAGDLLGLETSKYTETNPIQNNYNTLGRAVGGVGGMLALQALPGIGQAAAGGRIGAVALRAALQAGAGANQNWREQQDQMGYGDRLPGQYSYTSPAIAAVTSGAGQLGGRLLAGRQDKAWEAGKELAKKAWVGGTPNRLGNALRAVPKLATSPALEAVPNVAEESAQWLGEGLVDDHNLSASGLAGKAPLWQRLAVTGAFGAGADLGLNRGMGHFFPGTKAQYGPRIVKGDEIDPANPGAAYTDLTNLSATPDANPSELTNLTGEVKPNQQPRPPLADDSHIPFQEISKERDSRALVEGHNRALLTYGTQQLAQLEQDVEAAVRNRQPIRYLIERPDPSNPAKGSRLAVYRIGNAEIAVRHITDAEGNPKLALFDVTRDNEMGDQLDLRNQEVLQYLPKGKDRKHRAFLYGGDQHRALPGVGGKEHIEYTHEGQPYKVVTYRKDDESGPAIRWIGGIPLSEGHVPAGMHRIKEFELDSLQHSDLQERLTEALAAPRAKRKGKTKKKVLFQDELLAIAEEKDPQVRNQALRMLLQRYTEGGGGPIDLTDQGPIIPPMRGLPGDEGGGGGNGGSWPIPPPGSPGSGAIPPGATPTKGKTSRKLDPNQGPPMDPDVLMAKLDAGVNLTPEERAFLVDKGVLRQAPISGGAGQQLEVNGIGEQAAPVGLAPTVTPTPPRANPNANLPAANVPGPPVEHNNPDLFPLLAGVSYQSGPDLAPELLKSAVNEGKAQFLSPPAIKEAVRLKLLTPTEGEGYLQQRSQRSGTKESSRWDEDKHFYNDDTPRGKADALLMAAGEAMDAYYQAQGRRATEGGAQTVYAKTLGVQGIKAALAEKLLSLDEANHYLKLLTGKK